MVNKTSKNSNELFFNIVQHTGYDDDDGDDRIGSGKCTGLL